MKGCKIALKIKTTLCEVMEYIMSVAMNKLKHNEKLLLITLFILTSHDTFNHCVIYWCESVKLSVRCWGYSNTVIDWFTVWVCRSSGGGDWSQRQKGGAREQRLSLTAAAAGNATGDLIERDHDPQRFEPRLTSFVSLQNRQSLLEEKEEGNEELKRLQEVLERSEQEQVTLRHKLTDMEKELQTSLDQWAQTVLSSQMSLLCTTQIVSKQHHSDKHENNRISDVNKFLFCCEALLKTTVLFSSVLCNPKSAS